MLFFRVYVNQNSPLCSASPNRRHSCVMPEFLSSQTFTPSNLRTLKHTPSRHRDENPVTATPLESALTNCDARKPFRICSYENTGGVGVFFPFRNSSLTIYHSPLDSSCFFSHSSKLFYTYQKHNSLVFKQFRTLSRKHPGGGIPQSCKRGKKRVSVAGTTCCAPTKPKFIRRRRGGGSTAFL